MLDRLFPKHDELFEYLETAAGLVDSACQSLHALAVGAESERAAHSWRIHEIERECAEVTRRCVTELSGRLITPIDAADLDTLVQALNDFVNALDAVAAHCAQYKLPALRKEFVSATDLLAAAGKSILPAVRALEAPRTAPSAQAPVEALRRLGTEAEKLLRDALTSLFEEEEDPLLVIKLKDVLERTEKSFACCAKIANVLEKICLEAL